MADPVQDPDVMVRDADGRPGVVKKSELEQLKAHGGWEETPESLAEAEAAKARPAQRLESLKRGLNPLSLYAGYNEALTSGATLGASDLAATKLLGEDYRKGAAERRANPATLIPEIGGAAGAMVAGGLVTGGAGLGAGAARAATAGGRLLGAAGGAGEALGGAAARGLGLGATGAKGLGLLGRGAAEGAVMAAGQEVSAASLEDRDLTVDKLMAAAGHGALLGGGLNVAVGGASRVFGAAGRAALEGMGGGKGLGESIEAYGKKKAFEAVGADQIKYYNRATKFGTKPDGMLRIGGKLTEKGVELTNPVKATRTVDALLEADGRALRAIADQADGAGIRVSTKPILDPADELIAKLRQQESGHYDAIADAIEREIKPIRAKAARGESWSFGEMWAKRRSFDKVLKHNRDPRNPNPAADEFDKLRGIFDDALDDALDPVPAALRQRPDMAQNYARISSGEIAPDGFSFLKTGMRDAEHLRGAYKGAASANDVAAGRVTPAGFDRPLDPIRIDLQPGQTPILRDGRHRLMVAQENGATEIRAIISSFDEGLDQIHSVERVIPMPGMPRPQPDMRSAWLKHKEDYGDMRLVRDALGDLVNRRAKNRSASLSDHLTGGAGFLGALISGGSAVTAMATAAAVGSVNRQLRQKGPGVIARMADTISKLDRRTNKAIAAAVEGRAKDLPDLPKRTVPLFSSALSGADSGQPNLRTASAERERYEKTLGMIRDIASPNPSPAAAERLGNATRSLAEDFPELASLLHQRVIAAARALNDRAPVPLRRRQTLQPHLEDSRLPAGLIAKWLREVDAADTPESIWHDLARGRVPREKIEIVKLTQPYLFADWQTKVMKYVAEKSEKISRPQRIRLSLAFDFTGDPVVDPGFINQVQSEYMQQKEAEQQEQPSPPQGTNMSTKPADEMKPPTEQSLLATG